MNIKLEIELDFDPERKKVQVLSCVPISTEVSEYRDVHILKATQVKFGILTLGGKKLGKIIPCQKQINLYIDGKFYGVVSTHKQVKGRIDGLTKLYKEYASQLYEGKEIFVTYKPKENSLFLDTCEPIE